MLGRWAALPVPGTASVANNGDALYFPWALRSGILGPILVLWAPAKHSFLIHRAETGPNRPVRDLRRQCTLVFAEVHS